MVPAVVRGQLEISTTLIRDLRRARPANMRGAAHKNYRDLKGRRFDRQIPYRVMF